MTSPFEGPAVTVRDEGGHVLLAVLLVLVALSVLSAAAMVVAGSERRMSGSHRATVEAREVARSGLAEHLASGAPAVGRRIFTYGSDTAEVTTERLLTMDPGGASELYLVTARGVTVRPSAERNVARVVLRRGVAVAPAAALTAAPGVEVEGPAAAVSGVDACAAAPGPSLAGVAVADGGLGGDRTAVDGEPPVLREEDAPELVAAAGLDSAAWADLRRVDGMPAVQADPAGAWPDTFADWPLLRIEAAAATLGGEHSGRGTIVAAGDLHLDGGFEWDGLILAGGSIRSAGDAAVRGAAVAGLDVHLGRRPGPSSVAGASVHRFDSCALREAASRLPHGVREVSGGWLERL